MMFTDSPYEPLMKEICYFRHAPDPKPPMWSKCHGCAYWQGRACFGTCYRKLVREHGKRTLGQLMPQECKAKPPHDWSAEGVPVVQVVPKSQAAL